MKLLTLLDHSERYRLAHENLNEQNGHIELKSFTTMVVKTPLNDLTTMGVFGWVAKSKPGSTKPPSCCLVACFESEARLQ